MGFFVKELVGLVVWLVANVVYLNDRRTGRRGFQRVLAFWMGLPGTLGSLILVRERSHPRILPPPDDEDGLLAEVRRDRWLRAEGKRVEPPGSDADTGTGGPPDSGDDDTKEEGT